MQSFDGNKILLILIAILTGFTNWIASRNHYICIKENRIHVNTLYGRKKVFEGDLYLKIDTIIPGQSYYYLYLKNGRRFSFSRTRNKDIVTFFKEGDKGIEDKMNYDIRQELSKSSVEK